MFKSLPSDFSSHYLVIERPAPALQLLGFGTDQQLVAYENVVLLVFQGFGGETCGDGIEERLSDWRYSSFGARKHQGCVDQDNYPHMLSVRNCFIGGSVVRYVQLPPEEGDVELLHDATRREAQVG